MMMSNCGAMATVRYKRYKTECVGSKNVALKTLTLFCCQGTQLESTHDSGSGAVNEVTVGNDTDLSNVSG